MDILVSHKLELKQKHIWKKEAVKPEDYHEYDDTEIRKVILEKVTHEIDKETFMFAMNNSVPVRLANVEVHLSGGSYDGYTAPFYDIDKGLICAHTWGETFYVETNIDEQSKESFAKRLMQLEMLHWEIVEDTQAKEVEKV
jgi:hypothetical protein